ncbi:hypothetical protein K504DRAFT_501912 [Pleomassaria siparia CBS 279.74]|uniref:Cupin type-2 domain-containing protein n=1 Tax=Pleomassaria siparia CBS 279.74 TaxID=1314801 RepID=A0A6G1K8M7_9PLEO|nr:hypothetical protein K504DRAFT_501912 [Pleomassaria siparia CBS 279.74]
MSAAAQSPTWTESLVSGLPPNRRYILTHDASGKSIIHSSPRQLYTGNASAAMAKSFATSSTPADLTHDADISSYLSITGSTSHRDADIVPTEPSGSNLLVIDIAPGGEYQMHRTVSIDYSICVLGLIKMELDGGEWVELRPGDHVIQRGTMHKWYNDSQTEPARFVAVTLQCEPLEIPGTGKMLAEEHLAGTNAE